MPTRELFLAAALLFLVGAGSGADGAAEGPTVGARGGGRLPPPAASWSPPRRKREEEPPSYLKWVTFEGELPADTVSSWNNYTERVEYVCSTEQLGCNPGAYIPERGPFCFFPYGEQERNSHSFKVLVNVGGFEALDWVDGSFGSVPENAVEGCPSVDIFIGRNHYGLGKISKVQRAAFMMVEGQEVWYKWYQVLVVKKGPADVTISDVHYNMSGAVEHGEDVTLTRTTVRNEGCRALGRAATLEEVTEVENDWEVDQKVFATVHGVLQAALLTFTGTGWEVTDVTSVPWVGAASTSKYVVQTHVAQEEVRPRMACVVALEGHRSAIRVPFSAQLMRDFGSGHRHRVAVTGWARGRAVGGVRASVKQCWPMARAPPCRA